MFYSIKKFFTKLFNRKHYYNFKDLTTAVSRTYYGKSYISVDKVKKIFKFNANYYYFLFSENNSLKFGGNYHEIGDIISSTMKIQLPEINSLVINPDEYKEYYPVSNEDELREVIQSKDKVDIFLDNDIVITKPIEITNKSFNINGGGYSIFQISNVFDDYIYKGTLNGENLFIVKTDSGDNYMRLTKSEFYDALSNIEHENGDKVEKPSNNSGTAGIYRFKLPKELENISCDNMFINFSCNWVSYTMPVVKIENGYLYFKYYYRYKEGLYVVDFDMLCGRHKPTRFCLINVPNELRNDEGGVYVDKENNIKIYFSSPENAVYSIGESTTYPFILNKSKLNIFHVRILGYGAINVKNSTLLCDDIIVKGSVMPSIHTGDELTSGWGNNTTSIINLKRCWFSDLWRSALISGYGGKTIVSNCSFYDTDVCRSNYFSVTCSGSYAIFDNYFEDYGYGAIRCGKWNAIKPFKEECEIVYNNSLFFTPSYYATAEDHVVMDSAAIYNSPNNTNCLILNNKIVNYSGRGYNNAIYSDGGGYNITIAGNYAQGIKTGYGVSAINAYHSGCGYQGMDNLDDTNKNIYNNIFDSGVRMGVHKLDNKSILGVNIIDCDTKYPSKLEETGGTIFSKAKEVNCLKISSVAGVIGDKFRNVVEDEDIYL